MDLETRVVENNWYSSIDTSILLTRWKTYLFEFWRSGLQQIYVMKSDVLNVKRITLCGIYGTVWSPRWFNRFYKSKEREVYIGVMRSDGSGERLLTENFYQNSILVAKCWVLILQRNKIRSTRKRFSAKLWSIDITGYNERKIKTETDASDPSWSSLLSKWNLLCNLGLNNEIIWNIVGNSLGDTMKFNKI